MATSNPPSIVFFGSGPVAAESLRLLATDFSIEAVVTKPRPAHHKGSVPVLELCEELSLHVLQTADKQALDTLFGTRPVRSRLAVLIDFGIILSQSVIDYFELGIVNSHFSLLPEWRGADPITFSILSGQPITGVSLMLLVSKMDEGPLLAQAPFTITNHMTTPELTTALIDVSYGALKHILPLYAGGTVQPIPQDEEKMPTYSRKLTKADAELDFQKPAVQLEREVRAFAGWPSSRTRLAAIDIIITKAHIEAGSGTPGTLFRTGAKLGVQTSDGKFMIDELKPAGKKSMTAEAFLAGYGNTLGI